MEPRVPDCIDPELGRLAEPYLEGSLDPEQREAFELHSFRCAACLERLQLHQALPGALAEPKSPRVRWRVWLAAAALAAAAVVGVVFFAPLAPERPASPAVILLDGTLRSVGGVIPQVRVGRPIDLRLRAPVPAAGGVRYSLQILDPTGGLVFSSNGLLPSAPNEIQVLVPGGIGSSGRHQVVLEEHAPGEGAPVSYRFALDVTRKQP